MPKKRKLTGHPEYAMLSYFQKENEAMRSVLEKWLAHAEMNPGTFKSTRTGEWVPLVQDTRRVLQTESVNEGAPNE